jgi:hypothetical protein
VNQNGTLEADTESGQYLFLGVPAGELQIVVRGRQGIEAAIDLTIASTDESLVRDIPLERPWTNPLARHDVDANGSVVPQDVLVVVNHLNRLGSGRLIEMPDYESIGYVDVDGDGHLTPFDALLIVNEINRRFPSPSAESSGPDRMGAVASAPPAGANAGGPSWSAADGLVGGQSDRRGQGQPAETSAFSPPGGCEDSIWGDWDLLSEEDADLLAPRRQESPPNLLSPGHDELDGLNELVDLLARECARENPDLPAIGS